MIVNKSIIIGYLGPEGTYTQQALEELEKELQLSDVKKIALKSIDEVFESLQNGIIDTAVVPLRNTLALDYQETNSGLVKYKFTQKASIELKIVLALGIHPEAEKTDIKEIRSKDKALEQCSLYLRQHFPDALQVKDDSTATVMPNIIPQNLRHVACVGWEMGMKLYDLKIVDDDIGDDKNSFTTFLYLER